MHGNDLIALAAIDAEVALVRRNYCVVAVEFAHADKAKICEVGLDVAVTNGESFEVFEMVGSGESDAEQAGVDESEYGNGNAEMPDGFC